MGGDPPAPSGSDSSCDDEFSEAAAVGPSWSDLPIGIHLSILQYLEVPQRVAFASVCTTWRTAAVAYGIPRSSVPWFMSWADLIDERNVAGGRTVTCSFYHLLDVNKAYDVSFPRGGIVTCCGASHGWLVLVNELANLVLYNPFTTTMINLPPVTDFACVEAVYSSKGTLEHYIFNKHEVYGTKHLGKWFYQKAVLSCSPSKGGDYVVMIIHRNCDWLSFVKAGQSKWQVASTLPRQVASTLPRRSDKYTDCVYHDGRFYCVTVHGMVEEWDLDEPNGPTRKIVVAGGHCVHVLTRHLVSTTWGDLLHVRLGFAPECPDGVRFHINRVDSNGCKKVIYTDLMDHAIFLGLNHSACLPTKSFPGLQPHRIYYSASFICTETVDWLRNGWEGVRTYDVKSRTIERSFPLCDLIGRSNISSSEIWITPNL